MAQTQEDTTLADVLQRAQRLAPIDKVRLIERLAPEIERALPQEPAAPKRSLHGIVKEFGPAPSAEEIDEARREAWATFPRDDI